MTKSYARRRFVIKLPQGLTLEPSEETSLEFPVETSVEHFMYDLHTHTTILYDHFTREGISRDLRSRCDTPFFRETSVRKYETSDGIARLRIFTSI